MDATLDVALIANRPNLPAVDVDSIRIAPARLAGVVISGGSGGA